MEGFIMDFDLKNAPEAFPKFIKEELDSRGWTQEDLSEIVGRQSSVISGLINGKRIVSADIASDLVSAFGTTAQFWMNLEVAYQLLLESRENKTIIRKAQIFTIAPVKEWTWKKRRIFLQKDFWLINLYRFRRTANSLLGLTLATSPIRRALYSSIKNGLISESILPPKKVRNLPMQTS
jgi:plasmid maintenance system antidote protein VapI